MDWLKAVQQLRDNREPGVLVTVIEVRGHAPREAGAKMVVSREASWGSVGGGNLEATAIARAREPGQTVPGPPWALTRAEIDALAGGGLEPVRIEDMYDPQMPWPRRWRAEFRRPARQQPLAAVPG